MDKRLQLLTQWLNTTLGSARGLAVPLSGGSDSALLFWLLSQHLGAKTVGVHVGDSLRCRDWFESVGTVRFVPPIAGDDDPETLRWAKMRSLCLRERRWLLGSRNRTEDVFGTYSLASCTATHYPLIGLWKSDVMELCQLVGVPDEVLASSRQADPACGRPAEMADIPLEVVDAFLQLKVGGSTTRDTTALTEDRRSYLESIYRRNLFKQGLPVRGPIISTTG